MLERLGEMFALMWVFRFRISSDISLPDRVILREDVGVVPGHGFKRVIQRGNKEGSGCSMGGRSHTYSACLLWKCVY